MRSDSGWSSPRTRAVRVKASSHAAEPAGAGRGIPGPGRGAGYTKRFEVVLAKDSGDAKDRRNARYRGPSQPAGSCWTDERIARSPAQRRFV